ncbi:MAG: PPOX class F420-dependent oxidoreductase [Anaerolineaceae bacterium]|nr:PPOX class F420-dependent oxidoreductase [Anaerolineaceae bacterium]
MSVFTPQEIEYLQSQRLGRLATVNSKGKPQIAPVGFHYNQELDVIEIGGRFMSKSQKFRNVLKNPNVSIVVDDVLPPWRPRGVEIRGTAQTLPTGGKALFGSRYEADDAIIRISPVQIIGWGLETDSNVPMNRKVH